MLEKLAKCPCCGMVIALDQWGQIPPHGPGPVMGCCNGSLYRPSPEEIEVNCPSDE